MDSYQIYILVSVLVLAVVAVFLDGTSRNQQKKGLTRLAALSFGFIISGILFGGNRIVGYSLLGIGIILAVIDLYEKMSQRSLCCSGEIAL